MKRKQILSILLILVISILALGCRSKEEAPEVEDLSLEEELEEEEAPVDTVKEEGEEEKDEEEEEVFLKRIGQEGIGFISIPEDWVEFMDLNVNDSIQYSNIIGSSIISLNTFDISALSQEEQAEFSLEDAANSLWYNLESSGVEDIEGAIVELDNREAYQIYGNFISQDYNLPSLIITWLLEGDGGTFHYVSAEANEESIYEVFEYVVDSYSINE